MAKQKKKRNKQYSGSGAATTRPIVTKVQAANRSRLGQWWFDRKRILKPALIASLVVLAVVWLLFELIRLVSGG